MSRRVFTVLSALSLLLVMLPSVRAQEPVDQGCVRAGYGEADATWHVGVSAGQYANDRAEEMDPHAHHVKRAPSYGVQSRLFTRAIVVEGCNGERVALVKNDNYLAQDMLQRRTAQILAAEGSQVTYDRILLAATHNHSSPYVYSMAWGVQLFQDAFDIRAFEFQARRTAEAILEAEASMVSARMGATTVQHDIFKANIPGPEIADDDTPGGYPRDFGDEGIVVMRFDDAASGDPVAAWVNHGQHPESLDGYDLITADFLAPLERFVQRETGAPMVFSQGDVGSSEGPYEGWDVPQGRYLPDGTRRAWAHMGYAQAERGARYLADSIIAAFDQIGAGAGQVAYSDSFEVDAYEEGWIPGPISHPYPSVWNCRTENQATGKPNGPGVPTCGDVLHEIHEGERDPTLVAIYEGLKKLGVPIPEHGPLNGPAHMAVEENNRLRLQVVKVGDVVLGSCACEAQVDLILNFESRADDAVGNIWDGFDYDGGDPDHPEYDCVPNEDTTWTCTWPGGKTTVSDYYYQRMKAQVHNPADGWDALDYVPFANSEPYEPPDIKGNFTKEELSAEHGYKLAVGIGHAGDYNGYTVSYREYMNRDHYRKSLTSYGPHTADYMVTRMVWMAGALSGAPDRLAADPYYRLEAADEARQEALAVALGRASSGVYDNWYANLPEDKVPATLEDQVLEQPKDISRFDAAQFSWIGGSNAVDNPLVRVERLDDGEWTIYGDQSGEVQTFLEFPEAVSGVLETWGGEHEWRWTANFEAFDFGPRASIDPRASQVPEGDYRFVVAGRYRQGGADRDYELVSDAFSVTKWEGITVEDFRGEENGVSFTVTGATNPTETDIAPGVPEPQIRYPRTYDAPDVVRFIDDDDQKDVCETCSFRPWAVGSDVATATVTVERVDGSSEQVPATLREDRWFADVELFEGDRAFVARGGIVDTYGEINGQPSAEVVGTRPRPTELETTALSFTDDSSESVQYSDDATFGARLIDSGGDPIAGAEIVFDLSGEDGAQTYSATTGTNGVAQTTQTILRVPGTYMLTARFAETDGYLGDADVATFAVEKEDTSTSLGVQGKGSRQRLNARLADADSELGISQRVIEFFADGALIGSAETDGQGRASLQVPARYRGKGHDFEARFTGDDFYRGSSGTTRT